MRSDPSAAAGCEVDCDSDFCYEVEYRIRYEPIGCLERPLRCSAARKYLQNCRLFIDELLRGMGDPNYWDDQGV